MERKKQIYSEQMSSRISIVDQFKNNWENRSFFDKKTLPQSRNFFRQVVELTNGNEKHIEIYNSIKLINASKDSHSLDLNQVICLGDLHGDVVHFVHILLDYELIQIENYSHGPEKKDVDLLEIIKSPKFLSQLKWQKPQTLVLCLGDLCDSKRVWRESETKPRRINSVKDLKGVAKDQYFIMEYMLHIVIAYLRLLALEKKSDIFFVIGNHEQRSIATFYMQETAGHNTRQIKEKLDNAKWFCDEYVSTLSKEFFEPDNLSKDNPQYYNERAKTLGIFYRVSPLFAAHVRSSNLSLCVSHSGIRTLRDCNIINKLHAKMELGLIWEIFNAMTHEIQKVLEDFLWHRNFETSLNIVNFIPIKNIDIFAAGHSYSCKQAKLEFDSPQVFNKEEELKKIQSRCRRYNSSVKRTLKLKINEQLFVKEEDGRRAPVQMTPTRRSKRQIVEVATSSDKYEQETDNEISYFFIDTQISSCFLKPGKRHLQSFAETISFVKRIMTSEIAHLDDNILEWAAWVDQTKKHIFNQPVFIVE